MSEYSNTTSGNVAKAKQALAAMREKIQHIQQVQPPVLVAKPGTFCLIGGTTRATVNSVTIEVGGTVSYEVVWWVGSERKVQTVYAYELVRADDTQFTEIGFHTLRPNPPDFPEFQIGK